MAQDFSEEHLLKTLKKLRNPKNEWQHGKEMYVTKLGKVKVLLFYYVNGDIMIHITQEQDGTEVDKFRKVIPYSPDNVVIQELLSLKGFVNMEKDLSNLKKISQSIEDHDNFIL